jgi:CheY-like chemotaxis protein
MGRSAMNSAAMAVLRGRKVLVVDDIAVNRLLLQSMLCAEGMVVELACDGLQAVQRVESEARQFVAHGDSRIPARLDAMRETCSRHEELFLQHYWNTLRAHAQAHYVEERDIADILADLTQRYVTSDLDRRQRDLGTADPFQGER